MIDRMVTRWNGQAWEACEWGAIRKGDVLMFWEIQRLSAMNIEGVRVATEDASEKGEVAADGTCWSVFTEPYLADDVRELHHFRARNVLGLARLGLAVVPHQLTIAVDFDGTIVEHKYPKMGRVLPGALKVLAELRKEGHELILLTMRCDDELAAAISLCRAHGLTFDHVNANPSQCEWTGSPKVYANLYIDDAAVGAPLIFPGDGSRPYLDWSSVRSELVTRHALPRFAPQVVPKDSATE